MLSARYTSPRWWRSSSIVVALALLGSASWVGAGTVVVVQDQSNGILGGVLPKDANPLASYWRVGCDRAQKTVICWSCSSFQNRNNTKQQTDASIQLQLQQAHGPVGCTLACPRSKTDILHGQSQATVAACLEGTGQACFEVQIGFEGDPDSIAQGDYAVNLYATITAR